MQPGRYYGFRKDSNSCVTVDNNGWFRGAFTFATIFRPSAKYAVLFDVDHGAGMSISVVYKLPGRLSSIVSQPFQTPSVFDDSWNMIAVTFDGNRTMVDE